MRRTPGFAETMPGFTGPTRTVLLTLVGLYMTQLVASSWLKLPVVETLAWWPLFSEAFRPWQPLTSLLVHSPDPISALFSWLFILFFLPSVIQLFGWPAIRRGMAWILAGAVVAGLALEAIGAVVPGGPFMGIGPALTALTVIFGLSQPNARILLFFVIPIRAVWIAWGSGILALLSFLAMRSLDAAMWLMGWCAAWVWLQDLSWPDLRRPYLRWKQARLQRRLRKLTVIEGGRGRKPDSGDDGPLYH